MCKPKDIRETVKPRKRPRTVLVEMLRRYVEAAKKAEGRSLSEQIQDPKCAGVIVIGDQEEQERFVRERLRKNVEDGKDAEIKSLRVLEEQRRG